MRARTTNEENSRGDFTSLSALAHTDAAQESQKQWVQSDRRVRVGGCARHSAQLVPSPCEAPRVISFSDLVLSGSTIAAMNVRRLWSLRESVLLCCSVACPRKSGSLDGLRPDARRSFDSSQAAVQSNARAYRATLCDRNASGLLVGSTSPRRRDFLRDPSCVHDTLRMSVSADMQTGVWWPAYSRGRSIL